MDWKTYDKIQQTEIKKTLFKLNKYMEKDNGLTNEEKVQEVLTKGHSTIN